MLGISLLTPATEAGAIGTEQKLVEVGAEFALDLGDVFPGRQLHIAAAVATIATMLVNTGLLPAGFQGQPGLRRT